MNKKDMILILLLLLTAGIFYAFFQTGNEKKAGQVVVTLDKKTYGVYPLSEDKVFTVETDQGYNVIVIEKRQVYIKEADCPDGTCMKQGKISTADKSLVCLPHRLVVEVQGTQEPAKGELPDAVTH